ncbi:nuclear protein localization protein 4 [Serendipita sp. 411]|nr:nuclear protein localization protein 4 [Serendipita sp. 400]KAG8839860.1 nuclear protein localization protein 4 [Serendipita sp. 411]
MAIVSESGPSKPSGPGPARPLDNDGFEEIPPELLDEMGMDVDQTSGGGSRPRSRLDTSAGGLPAGSATKICPHCTFENSASAVDCDVCGLPLV